MTTPPVILKATYASPTSQSFTLSQSLPAPPSLSASSAEHVQVKSAHIKALRAAISDLQDKINTELTARMEEDKAREAAAAAAAMDNGATSGEPSKNGAGTKRKAAVDEEAEEENYGEEVVEED